MEEKDYFAEGVEAANTGQIAASCPYEYDTPEGQEWLEGYESAGGEE